MSDTSQKRIEANRRNSAKSTGPKTAEGKARSSRNAITHGLFAKALVLDGEDPKQFEQFKNGMLLSLNPRNMLELQITDRIIAASWKLEQRVRPAESMIYWQQARQLEQNHRQPIAEQVEKLEGQLQSAEGVRDRSRTCRDQCQAECDRIEAELNQARRQLEEPFPDPAPGRLLGWMLKSADDDPIPAQAIERLHRYEQQLDNSMLRWLKQLQQMQKHEVAEPSELVREMLGLDENEAKLEEVAGGAGRVEGEEEKVEEENEANEGANEVVNSRKEEELATDGAQMDTDEEEEVEAEREERGVEKVVV